MTKLRDLIDTEPDVREAPDAVELPPIEGAIVFDDLTFGYDPAHPVIDDVSLSIAPGETVAFVGPTGAGKSTLAKLVTRFYDPTAGRVLIDGHDLRDVTMFSLRSQLGVVPAGAVPLRRDHRGQHRLRPAQRHRRRDPRGGGQGGPDRRHRAHARRARHRGPRAGPDPVLGRAPAHRPGPGLPGPPRVLVLDEATSNLDLQSETKIESALDVLLENRTAILIAHRLSTAMRADRIVVVDEGRIIEAGTHAELVAAGGRYAEMYATWVHQSDLSEHEDRGAPLG